LDAIVSGSTLHVSLSIEQWHSTSSLRFWRCEKMLYYALVFFVIALVAALLGFGGIAVAFAGIAKLLFVLFIVLFLVSLVMHLGRRV
jgi:uncharacterized membrane protein YtjA (UPF0391 family)